MAPAPGTAMALASGTAMAPASGTAMGTGIRHGNGHRHPARHWPGIRRGSGLAFDSTMYANGVGIGNAEKTRLLAIRALEPAGSRRARDLCHATRAAAARARQSKREPTSIAIAFGLLPGAERLRNPPGGRDIEREAEAWVRARSPKHHHDVWSFSASVGTRPRRTVRRCPWSSTQPENPSRCRRKVWLLGPRLPSRPSHGFAFQFPGQPPLRPRVRRLNLKSTSYVFARSYRW